MCTHIQKLFDKILEGILLRRVNKGLLGRIIAKVCLCMYPIMITMITIVVVGSNFDQQSHNVAGVRQSKSGITSRTPMKKSPSHELNNSVG